MSSVIIKTNSTSRGYLAVAAGFYLLLNIGIVGYEARYPQDSVFEYKVAGINLAGNGRTQLAVAANGKAPIPLNPNKEKIQTPRAHISTLDMAAPLYPLLFAGWTQVVGEGLRESILFDQFIRLARSLLIFMFVFPWLVGRLNYNEPKAVAALALITLFSFLPFFNDQPLDLALTLGLACWYLLLGRPRFKSNAARAIGILIGLTASANFCAGVLFALGARYLWKRAEESGRRPPDWIVPALLVYVGVVIAGRVVFASFPVDRISFANFDIWSRAMRASFLVGPAAAMGIAFYVMRKSHHDRDDKRMNLMDTITLRAVPGFFVLSLFEPSYLWFPFSLLFLMSLLMWLCPDDRPSPVWVIALLFLAVVPGLYPQARDLAIALETPDAQSSRAIRDRVLSYVTAQSTLGVSADQFFTFLGARNVKVKYYACPWEAHHDFVYVSSREERRARFRVQSNACQLEQHCYTSIEDLREVHPLILLGQTMPLEVYGNGGQLFKNTNCSNSYIYASARP